MAASLARLRERALGDMVHQLRRLFQVAEDLAKLSTHTLAHNLVAPMELVAGRASDGSSVANRIVASPRNHLDKFVDVVEEGLRIDLRPPRSASSFLESGPAGIAEPHRSLSLMGLRLKSRRIQRHFPLPRSQNWPAPSKRFI